jgi:signal transduction histidine kinase
LNYVIPKFNEKSHVSFVILFDDTILNNKQSKLINDILIISIIILIFSICISLLQISNEKSKLDATESYLEEVQKKIIESEKFSALTNLISGFAHKLNSPIGAILAATNNLEYNYNIVFDDYLKFIKSLNEKEFLFFQSKVDKIFNNNLEVSRKQDRESLKYINNYITTKYPKFQYKIDKLSSLFNSIHVVNSDEIDSFIINVNEDILIDFIYNLNITSLINKNTFNIKKSASDTSNFIKSLKLFSNDEMYSSQTIININQLLKNILLELKPQYENRINITLNLHSLSDFMGYSEELRKTFKEIIFNSIQSIPEKGNIIIESKYNQHQILVNDYRKSKYYVSVLVIDTEPDIDLKNLISEIQIKLFGEELHHFNNIIQKYKKEIFDNPFKFNLNESIKSIKFVSSEDIGDIHIENRFIDFESLNIPIKFDFIH